MAATTIRLRAIVGFYRSTPAGLVLVQPGEVFRAPIAEALDLLNWQRCASADGEARLVPLDTRPAWTRLETRSG